MDETSAPTSLAHVATFSGTESLDAADALERGRTKRASRPALLAICIVGLILTAIGTWGAARTDQNTEQRLLEERTRQAAAVLSSAITNIQQPMSAALDVQASVRPSERKAAFGTRFARNVGTDKLFVSASLWQPTTNGYRQLSALGATTGLNADASQMQQFLQRARTSKTSVVTRVSVGGQTRIGYALADPETGFVVYAERAIASNRRAPVDQNSAYAGLEYAIYLGPTTSTSAMTTTDVDPADLPLRGDTFRATVPFGDTELTLVTRQRGHLGSTLSRSLPWVVAVGGALLTLLVAAAARQMLRSRDRAESDTDTITTLYQKVDTLYGEQRDLSESLQRALLPRVIPDLPGVEIAAEYVAGAKGIDIGGDWYSVIGTGEDTFAFVIGDVSGHGIDAVAEMARARFTVRAYLVDGITPADALEKCSRQFDIATDGHIVTVIAGVGNRSTGEITLANAGHPQPLLVATDGTSRYINTPVGAPLGAGVGGYEATTFTIDRGSALLTYTDGLVERRGEDIGTGLDRLKRAVQFASTLAADESDRDLDRFITSVLDTMRDEERADDIAVLAIRRTQG